MPPHVKSREVPRLNGLKLRVNAWSPEPAATTHGCALAADLAVVAATAVAAKTAVTTRAATAPKSVPFRTGCVICVPFTPL